MERLSVLHMLTGKHRELWLTWHIVASVDVLGKGDMLLEVFVDVDLDGTVLGLEICLFVYEYLGTEGKA